MDRPPRKVHLPLERLKKCDACSKTTNLKLCSACGERAYCSTECQGKDWSAHKPNCGKTDRIPIEMFYPLLASFGEVLHTSQQKPTHPALRRTIINSPNPGSPATVFPDGSAANLVMLGDFINPIQLASSAWWPTALSDKVRRNMMRRIVREGYALPVATSICLALLSGMYTTTFVPSSNVKLRRRTRLSYKSSPIADFGVATGSVDVKPQDELAYLDASDLSFRGGQEAKEHYWVYFTTIRGENIILDCSMFSLNMCVCVDTYQYLPKDEPSNGPLNFAPAVFSGRDMRQYAPKMHKERKRMSVLRNADLQRIIAESADGGFYHDDIPLVRGFMEALSGRPVPLEEVELTMNVAARSTRILTTVLDTRSWTAWPKEPPMGIEGDPGELRGGGESSGSEEWLGFMRKFRKKYNQPDADKEALGRAYRKWRARNAEEECG
ncbi:hypothetical protein FB45DRAFT_736580 [Roridomyces roridus]|uniref:MYND-type domain-containing protein n=1 Tax=Roridomyces roridus TaxID=1738132 RepID=A0AAD7CAD1_9AGAR|nr:hypothetical protein FB45DRAFT_736580 [Roridomyces roridus]